MFLTSCFQEPHKDLSIFKYNETSGINSLDPAFAKDQATVWATNQLFNGLVQLDQMYIFMNTQFFITKQE